MKMRILTSCILLFILGCSSTYQAGQEEVYNNVDHFLSTKGIYNIVNREELLELYTPEAPLSVKIELVDYILKQVKDELKVNGMWLEYQWFYSEVESKLNLLLAYGYK